MFFVAVAIVAAGVSFVAVVLLLLVYQTAGCYF